MLTTILMYLATLIIYPRASLFLGMIPAAILGVLNISRRNRNLEALYPDHPLYKCVLIIPALATLFLADWLWKLLAGQGLPLIIVPILLAFQIRTIRNPAVNASGVLIASMTALGLILFVPIYIVLTGFGIVRWW